MDRLRTLQRITQAKSDLALMPLRKLSVEEQRLRRALKDLAKTDYAPEKMQAEEVSNYSGVRQAWMNWSDTQIIALNSRLAGVLADKEVALAEASNAVGRNHAVEAVLSRQACKTGRSD